MPIFLVLQFHVLHFRVRHFQRPMVNTPAARVWNIHVRMRCMSRSPTTLCHKRSARCGRWYWLCTSCLMKYRLLSCRCTC